MATPTASQFSFRQPATRGLSLLSTNLGGARSATLINSALPRDVFFDMAPPAAGDGVLRQYQKVFCFEASTATDDLLNARAYIANALEDLGATSILRATFAEGDIAGAKQLRARGMDDAGDIVTELVDVPAAAGDADWTTSWDRIDGVDVQFTVGGAWSTLTGNVTLSVEPTASPGSGYSAIGVIPAGQPGASSWFKLWCEGSLDGTTTNGGGNNCTVAPGGSSFTKPSTYATGETIAAGTIEPNTAAAIWVVMEIPEEATVATWAPCCLRVRGGGTATELPPLWGDGTLWGDGGWGACTVSLDIIARLTSATYQELILNGGSVYGVDTSTNLYIQWNATQKDLAALFGGPVAGSVKRAVNQLTEWELHLVDDEGEFDPAHTTSGWQDYLRPTPYPNSEGQFAKKVVLQVTHGGVTVTLCSGPIVGRQQQGSSRIEDGWSHQIRGFDMGHKLTPGAKNLQSQWSTGSSVITNHTVITAIAAAAKIEIDLSRLTVMPMPDFHSQNQSYLAALMDVLESCGGDFAFRGETLQCWDPHIKAKEAADWTYDLENDAVEEVTHDESAATIVNVITVIRSRNLDNVAGRASGSGIGNGKTVTFGAPIVTGTIGKQTNVGGILSDFYLLDASDNIIAVFSPRGPTPPITGSWPAVSCTATFGQQSPLDTGDFWAYEVIGRTADDATYFGADFDEVLSKTYRFEGSIAKYGEFPLEIYDPYLPNESWMRNRAERAYYRALGDAERRSFRVPYNPEMLEGDTVRVQYPETGEDVALYVLEVEHPLAIDPADRMTTFTGVQYR